MNHKKIKLFLKFILLINLLFLFSCSGVKERVGLIKRAPDEFQVYEKKPLSVPPNFELRPPADSDMTLQDSEEKNIIFSEEIDTNESLTIGDEVLLITLGDKEIEKDIRKKINNENSILEVEKPLLDKIIDFDPIFEKPKEDKVINAEEEKKRIEELRSEIEDIETNLEMQENNSSIVNKNTETISSDDIALEDDEKSFLDKILDFELFSSEDEELDGTNQRDRTFFNKKKDKIVSDNNQIDSNEKRDKVDSINDENKIIDAVISEKEGSID